MNIYDMINKAVNKAFPKLQKANKEIIVDWYDKEEADEPSEFSTVGEYADYIKDDFLDMFWAGDYNSPEFKNIQKDMVACGYYDVDQFPKDEESEDVSVLDPGGDEKEWLRIAKREGMTPAETKRFIDNRRRLRALATKVKENTKVTVKEEFDTEDGWDCDEIRDSGLMDTLRKCANVEYNLRTCIRTAANWGDTLADLKAYINELAEELQNAVADFPDEDEEQSQDAMGDDEEIEVMEGKRDHVDFDPDTLDFLAREYFRGLANSKDVGSLQGFIKFVWGKRATPDDIEKATKAIAPYVMSPNVKVVDDD